MNPSSAGSCDLCGLSLHRGAVSLTSDDRSYDFCCRGCQQVFRILMEASESSSPTDFKKTPLFKECQTLGIIPVSEKDLDHIQVNSPLEVRKKPHFDGHDRDQMAPGDEKVIEFERLPLFLNVSGMWCPACAWVIEEALRKDPGISKPTCHFSTDRLRCEYDPILTSPEKITAAIHQLGYEAVSDGGDEQSVWKKKESIRFAVSAFLTMNIMMLSFALYSGYFTNLSPLDIQMISWPILLMAIVVFFYGGMRIHRRALSGFTTAAFGMETLISVGSSVAFIYSTYRFMQGSLHLYFDTAAMLITLVLLGKTLETRAKDEVTSDLDTFFSLRPKKVRISTATNSEGRYVSADQLKSQDLFILEPDERVAADGIVEAGTGVLDESSLTGEALPVNKQPGDHIHSGSTVISGQLKVRAQRVGDDSILGQMITIMEKTLEQRTPLEGKTDRLLQWFVPGVIGLSLATGLGWYIRGIGVEMALIRAVTVLVISCPCALGIAIPLTRIAGIALAARRGILIRDFASFERAPSIREFVFDKTGTVTEGEWQLILADVVPPFKKKDILAVAAGLEKHSDHTIARAIQGLARKSDIVPAMVAKVNVHENGLSGIRNGDAVKIGSWGFTELEKEIKPDLASGTRDSPTGYTSRVYLTVNGILAATFQFGDRLKAGTQKTIAALHQMGYATSLVSGDDDHITQIVGRAIGVGHAAGDMLPAAKAEVIHELKTAGQVVAMVGDGINDAPALAKSDLALAFHGNHMLGKEVADVSFMRGDPIQIIDYLKLAGRVNRKIHQNFFGAFFYNIISIPIAISGMLSPLVAVSAMLLSSLSVISNTLLLIKTKRL